MLPKGTQTEDVSKLVPQIESYRCYPFVNIINKPVVIMVRVPVIQNQLRLLKYLKAL